jgi:hypothetical protein
MVTVSKEELTNYLLLKNMADLHNAKSKVDYYEAKYKKVFPAFELYLGENEIEKFEEHDDYIEWKAYSERLALLTSRLEEIRNGNIQIAG